MKIYQVALIMDACEEITLGITPNIQTAISGARLVYGLPQDNWDSITEDHRTRVNVVMRVFQEDKFMETIRSDTYKNTYLIDIEYSEEYGWHIIKDLTDGLEEALC